MALSLMCMIEFQQNLSQNKISCRMRQFMLSISYLKVLQHYVSCYQFWYVFSAVSSRIVVMLFVFSTPKRMRKSGASLMTERYFPEMLFARVFLSAAAATTMEKTKRPCSSKITQIVLNNLRLDWNQCKQIV